MKTKVVFTEKCQGSTLNGRRQWCPTPVLLPGKSHGRRSLVGCSPWGFEESDMTERLHFHFSLAYIGKGNGNTLQCSCLENPRDGGAWWAAVYGVVQSQTRLKRLSSSSSRHPRQIIESKYLRLWALAVLKAPSPKRFIIIFWLCWVFVVARGLSLVVVRGGFS